ncbi:glycoside hydrolase superfamily [Microdochium trichocladiopsis]|uniref:Glycoside hydrolase superfamily n=1 Tax=Microdochium trichocladiopsis TaxID=1682393 RepID=A0A9P8YD15_9PEZI|nr:glycoside hydrolase superfamily [Microdochium trichocladiopsis]KAH7034818.1 glycoside hydrolase superfamily [Microdochium trichocladiopsis]
MSYQSKDFYPRPDFVRSNNRWSPLNDGWTILYDDDDVGLEQLWHIKGVPDKVTFGAPASTNEPALTEAEAQTLSQFPELREKGFETTKHKKASATEHAKCPINVPFAFQTPASGIHDNEAHEVLWYERSFTDPRGRAEPEGSAERVILRFGAVDYDMTLWASGVLVGSHRGGHVPIELDVTDALSHALATTGKGDVRLVMRVRDSPHDLAQPRGKQYWAPQPESIFYTPTSGIWQPVWCEVVPSARIGDGSAGTTLDATNIAECVLSAKIAVPGRRAGHKYSVEIKGLFQGQVVNSAKVELPNEKDYVQVNLALRLSEDWKSSLPQLASSGAESWRDGLALWSPSTPNLYDLKIRLLDAAGNTLDEVNTYTGFRQIAWDRGDSTVYLNDEPLFQALVLDQGYWPETGLTPPTPESCRLDIELSKEMGFNGCRKHQKVEDPTFLYWADKLGYLVWGEMANAYEFSDSYAASFDAEWAAAVRRDINHPCVVAWTPANESWGYPSLKDSARQRNHLRSLYFLTKTLDPTRPINDNCGWEHVVTDLTTFHSYEDRPKLAEMCADLEGGILGKMAGGRDLFVQSIDAGGGGGGDSEDPGARHKPGAPVICTEFGGVNIAPPAEKHGNERDWGYTTATDPGDLLRRIEGLMMAVVKGGHCCGFVYTQLTDIEQEVNGLYSFDRKEKIPAVEVKKIIDAAAATYFELRNK